MAPVSPTPPRSLGLSPRLRLPLASIPAPFLAAAPPRASLGFGSSDNPPQTAPLGLLPPRPRELGQHPLGLLPSDCFPSASGARTTSPRPHLPREPHPDDTGPLLPGSWLSTSPNPTAPLGLVSPSASSRRPLPFGWSLLVGLDPRPLPLGLFPSPWSPQHRVGSRNRAGCFWFRPGLLLRQDLGCRLHHASSRLLQMSLTPSQWPRLPTFGARRLCPNFSLGHSTTPLPFSLLRPKSHTNSIMQAPESKLPTALGPPSSSSASWKLLADTNSEAAPTALVADSISRH